MKELEKDILWDKTFAKFHDVAQIAVAALIENQAGKTTVKHRIYCLVKRGNQCCHSDRRDSSQPSE